MGDHMQDSQPQQHVNNERFMPRIEKTAPGTAYVTTVKTWFIDLMNFASQCTDDYQAYNAWKTLGVFANGMLEEALRDSKVELSQEYKDKIEALKLEWDSGAVTRVQKTTMKALDRGNKRITQAGWDSYLAESFQEGAELMLQYIHREKYNHMAAVICVWCGKCARVLFGAGMISVNDTITIPFQQSTEYDERGLSKDMQKRRAPTRLIRPQQPEQR